MIEPFELSEAERNSPLWRRLEAHLNESLAQARAKNDVHQPENQTAETRGRIAELKRLIALGKPIEPLKY